MYCPRNNEKRGKLRFRETFLCSSESTEAAAAQNRKWASHLADARESERAVRAPRSLDWKTVVKVAFAETSAHKLNIFTSLLAARLCLLPIGNLESSPQYRTVFSTISISKGLIPTVNVPHSIQERSTLLRNCILCIIFYIIF